MKFLGKKYSEGGGVKLLKNVNMERGNSSQLFVHLLGYILKVKGTQVEQEQRKTFLEFVAILNLPPLHCWCSHCHFQLLLGSGK